jgi:hypothetical protein
MRKKLQNVCVCVKMNLSSRMTGMGNSLIIIPPCQQMCWLLGEKGIYEKTRTIFRLLSYFDFFGGYILIKEYGYVTNNED